MGCGKGKALFHKQHDVSFPYLWVIQQETHGSETEVQLLNSTSLIYIYTHKEPVCDHL